MQDVLQVGDCRDGAPAQASMALQRADELRHAAAWLQRASDACWSAGRLETARVLRAKAYRELADAEQAERYAAEWAPGRYLPLGRGS